MRTDGHADGDLHGSLSVVIKQEETSDSAIHCSSVPISALSQTYAKQAEGTTNRSLQSKHALSLDMNMHLADAALLPFRVKEEPASDDENWEQKGGHTGDDPQDIELKQEITFEEYLVDSMDNEVNLKEETEEESGSEADESALCVDSALVKSVSDTDISEEDTDKQKEECSNRRQIFQKQIIKLCQASAAGYTCSVCGRIFSKTQRCLLHIWHRHAGDKPHVCKLCGKAYKSYCGLKWHKASHSDERPYSCDICGKSFKREDYLGRHKTYHSNERPYSCDACEKAFKTKAYLQQHKYTCHSNEKPYSCDECGESFQRIVQLDRHKAHHTNERPYSCDVCGKTFRVKGDVNRHQATHANDRSHVCDVCEKAFRTKACLWQHKNSCHSDRRPYVCDVCEKAFKRKDRLLRHKQSCGSNVSQGSDGEVYPCDECGSSFKRKGSMKQHKMRCHINKRPKSCDASWVTFTRHVNAKCYETKHNEANQLHEHTKSGNENARFSLDTSKILFTYSKLTNLRIKQQLTE